MLDFLGEDYYEMREREAADLQSEQDRAALLHGWVWCPACTQYTLPPFCRFCGGDTMFFREDAAGAIPTRSRSNDSSSDSRASLKPSTQPPASSSGAGGRVATHKEKAA